MQVKQALVASAIALGFSVAFADGIMLAPEPATSNVTRAQVKAELQHARATGKMQPAGEADFVPPSTPSNVSRAEVKAELAAARAHGQTLAAGEAGYNVSNEYTTASVLTRNEVRAEAIATRKSGQVLAGEAGSYGAPLPSTRPGKLVLPIFAKSAYQQAAMASGE